MICVYAYKDLCKSTPPGLRAKAKKFKKFEMSSSSCRCTGFVEAMLEQRVMMTAVRA